MKTQGFKKTGFTLALFGAAMFTLNVFGQATPAATTVESTPPPLMPNSSANGPYLSPATSQVLQLTQAKVSDSTIIAYVQSSTTMYGLNADQIIYLKQQGVSDNVLNAMLNQSAHVAANIAAQTPPQNYGQNPAPEQSSTAVVQPTTAAPSSVYVVPDSQTAGYNAWASQYSYPVYSSYPYYPYYYWPITFSFYGGYYGGYYRGGYYCPPGYHGGYWGGGWHGGYYGGGGYHTGGTWGGSSGYHGVTTGGGYHSGGMTAGGGFHGGGGMGGGGMGGGHH